MNVLAVMKSEHVPHRMGTAYEPTVWHCARLEAPLKMDPWPRGPGINLKTPPKIYLHLGGGLTSFSCGLIRQQAGKEAAAEEEAETC